MTDDATVQLIVRLPGGNTIDDVDLRYRIEDAIEEGLPDGCLSRLAGGSSDGMMEVCADLQAHGWERALTGVRSVLMEANKWDRASVLRAGAP